MQPTLLDFPIPIRTQRLIIRPLMPGDGKMLFTAIDESRVHLSLWLDWVKNVHTWHDSELTARQFYADFVLRKSLNFVIYYDNNLAGMCSIHNIDWLGLSGELGYWCHVKFQKQGLITEAATTLIHYAQQHLNLQQLVILCDQHNLASIKIAEKLGFKLTATANDNLIMQRYVKLV